MAESLLKRVQRVISARVEDTVEATVDPLGRANGTRVMREAIREVDRVIDDARAEQDAAITIRLRAMRRQRLFRGQIAALDDKACFAIESHREDLAEAAVSRRLAFEAQAEHLETVIALSASEADRLTAGVAALKIRKKEMEAAFAAFESAWRDAGSDNGTAEGLNTQTAHRVEHAAEVFDRAMTGAGGAGAGGAGAGGTQRVDTDTEEKIAEIDILRKQAAIADRMATLRAAPPKGTTALG